MIHPFIRPSWRDVQRARRHPDEATSSEVVRVAALNCQCVYREGSDDETGRLAWQVVALVVLSLLLVGWALWRDEAAQGKPPPVEVIGP